MNKKTEFLKKVAEFLVERCEGLGYIPLVTKSNPGNKQFFVSPGPDAVYVKLFGHFNYSINSVHGKFAVLDPDNLESLGSLADDNLCLTETEKFLLTSHLLSVSHSEVVEISSKSKSLSDLFYHWEALKTD